MNKKYLYFIFAVLLINVYLLTFFFGNLINKEEDVNNKVSKEKTTEVVEKKNEKKVTITAAGDCTLGWDTNFGYTNRFDDVFNKNNGDYSYFFKNVYPKFSTDDLTIVNLEGTFTSSNERVEKKFNFKAPVDYVNILKEGNVDIVSFANNHAHDYAESGYKETLDTLDNADIPNYGYTRYLIKEVNGIKIGFFGLLDIYGERYSEVDKAIAYLKENNCDLIIASMHWGIEKDYEYAAFQSKMGHYLIDNGVDLVIGTHPHVIQGIEKYKDRYILYSLANFSFGGNKNPNDKDTYIYQQTFTFKDNELVLDDNINIIPASVSSIKEYNNYQPTVLDGAERDRVMDKILSRSKGFEYKR